MSLKTTIVVPCYNEAKRLALPRFADFADQHPDCGFLFVNDGSTDGTLAMLTEFCQTRAGQLRVLNLEQNQGKAGAVRLGMCAALGETSTVLAGYWDADLATDLNVIPQFVEEFERHPKLEIALGSRVRLMGRQIHRKLLRHLLGRCFATAASLVLKLPVYDTQCGAKMFRAGPDLRRIFEDPFRARWIFDVEILARYLRLRRSEDTFDPHECIHEVPLPAWKDVGGSRVKPFDFLKAAVDLWRIRSGKF